MWDQLLKDNNLSAADFDMEHSIFVGDAGGRTEAGKAKKDFSCSDRDMAANAGVPYQTPEEFFLGEQARPFVRTFEPGAMLEASQRTDAGPVVFGMRNEVEIVVFVGCPGAGKSTFYWNHLKPLGFERVNQDILKTVSEGFWCICAMLITDRGIGVSRLRRSSYKRGNRSLLVCSIARRML